MTAQATAGGGAAGSERVLLARAALGAALALADVAGSTAGPLGAYMTQSGAERLAGVLAAAGTDGRYELTLWLIARPVALIELADQVRDAVRRVVGDAGLLDQLGPIHVRWVDLATDPPGEA